MVQFGLDVFLENFPKELHGKRIGIVCHAASITSSYSHCVDVFQNHPNCTLSAIFGPQHGLFGQTQDNMIEWEGGKHSVFGIPVYSLYGAVRKPTPIMLRDIDALIFDVQDVGARPYTYVWTLKLCMEACMEQGIPIWVLDRPNPIACMEFDGPVLQPDHFTFVGGAPIPLCHRMTMGEMATMMQSMSFPGLALHVVWMEGWKRNSVWNETGLPWVLPSPNMPTLETAMVYPGMVLFEATNISEGRGTTRPFEIFGAPFIPMAAFKKNIYGRELSGCIVREHGFIPTFQKWKGQFCYGMQIHITNPRIYNPVTTALEILSGIIDVSGGQFVFKEPPYEYETEKMPFDILIGNSHIRRDLKNGVPVKQLKEKWSSEYDSFKELFNNVRYYEEE